MNKRITSIVLSLVMLFTMLATAVPVFAATPVALKVTADTTSAHPGDTINYKVFVGAVTNMGGLEFRLNIPSGLTIVDGSISIPTGLETTIDSDGAIVVPKSGNGYKWSYSAQMTGYTGSSDLVILNFACTVDDGASGDKIVTINVDTFFDNDPPYPELDYTVTPATVNVTAAPVSVTGVTIDETLSVNIGQTKTPSFTVAPAEATNKTVSFTSDNPAVATVNATTGEVTGVKKGTATITVKTADGNFTDTCTVTVSCSHTNKTPVAEKPSTCKEQGWEAYSKCNDCGQLFDKNGNEIDAVPTRSLAAHTAQHHARVEPTHAAAGNIEYWTCSVCNKYFSDAACTAEITQEQTVLNKIEHSFGSDWKSNADQHWHECSCGEKNAIANHTFEWKTDTAATEDATGLKHEECTDCHYKRNENTVIPKLEHTHAWRETPAKASTCTEQGNNQYFYCTKCEKYFKANKVTETTVAAETLPLASHTESNWKSDANGHWKECTKCGAITTEKVAHTPDREAATETDAVKCSVCDYVITHALGLQEYTIDLPFSLAVKLTGDKKPAKETFKFEIYDLGVEDAEFEIVKDSITAENIAFDENGVAFIEGSLKIKVTGEDQLSNLTEGFSVRMVKGSTKGWTYASEQWRIEPFFENDALDLKIAVKEIVDGEISEVYANGMSFSVGYEAVTEPGTPQTGDSSMMVLWIALFVVSGAGATYCTLSGADNSVQFHALKVPHTEKGKGAPCPRQARIKQKPWEHNTPKAFIGYYRPLGAICT